MIRTVKINLDYLQKYHSESMNPELYESILGLIDENGNGTTLNKKAEDLIIKAVFNPDTDQFLLGHLDKDDNFRPFAYMDDKEEIMPIFLDSYCLKFMDDKNDYLGDRKEEVRKLAEETLYSRAICCRHCNSLVPETLECDVCGSSFEFKYFYIILKNGQHMNLEDFLSKYDSEGYSDEHFIAILNEFVLSASDYLNDQDLLAQYNDIYTAQKSILNSFGFKNNGRDTCFVKKDGDFTIKATRSYDTFNRQLSAGPHTIGVSIYDHNYIRLHTEDCFTLSDLQNFLSSLDDISENYGAIYSVDTLCDFKNLEKEYSEKIYSIVAPSDENKVYHAAIATDFSEVSFNRCYTLDNTDTLHVNSYDIRPVSDIEKSVIFEVNISEDNHPIYEVYYDYESLLEFIYTQINF